MFDSVLLAVLEGCKTANDGKTAGWGSPAWGLRERGANCVIGFTEIIYVDRITPQGKVHFGAETWSRVFWQRVAEGHTIRAAVNQACDETNGSNMARQQTRIFEAGIAGSSSTGKFRIHPARYNVAPIQ